MPRKLSCIYEITVHGTTKSELELEDNTSVGIKYSIEKAPTTGSLHVQGIIYFRKSKNHPQAVNYVKSLFPEGKHPDCRQLMTLLHMQNVYNYVAKPETHISGPYMFGCEFPKNVQQKADAGARNDFKQFVEDGKTMPLPEFKDKYLYMEARYPKFYAKYLPNSVRHVPQVMIQSAPPGVGKTRGVYESYGKLVFSSNDCEYKWFDGYVDNEIAILENFHMYNVYGKPGYDTFLRVIDRYPILVQVKGSFVPFNPKIIIINTTECPWDWRFNGVDRDEFFRRINIITIYCTETNNHILQDPDIWFPDKKDEYVKNLYFPKLK